VFYKGEWAHTFIILMAVDMLGRWLTMLLTLNIKCKIGGQVGGGGGKVEKCCLMVTVCSGMPDMWVDTDDAVDTVDQAI